MTKLYFFAGKVLPEREAVGEIRSNLLRVKQEDWNLTFDIRIAISKSQISAVVSTEKETNDILTLRNYVDEVIRIVVDSYGYVMGCGYEVEITSVTDENNRQIVFDVGIKAIADNEGSPIDRFVHLGELASDSPHLRFALSNLRDAIRRPSDTGFHCYRAVENIRQAFKESQSEPESREERLQSWNLMNRSLNIDEEFSKYLTTFANPQRHGWTKPMTQDVRIELMRRARNIIDRFCVYLERGRQRLNEAEFPILKEEKGRM